MVPLPELESGTLCLEGKCSIQLSYKGISGWLDRHSSRLSSAYEAGAYTKI